MRKRRSRLSLVCSMLVSLGFSTSLGAQTAGGLDAKVIAAQRELDQRLLDAHEQKSTEQVLSLFSQSPDVFFIAPNGILNKGRDGIRRSYEPFLAALESIHAEIKEVSYIKAGEGVIAVGVVTFDRKFKDGRVEQKTVIWTDYRRIEDGKWVYVFRHAHWPLATGKTEPPK